jgi:hypothetical protein
MYKSSSALNLIPQLHLNQTLEAIQLPVRPMASSFSVQNIAALYCSAFAGSFSNSERQAAASGKTL